MALKDWKKRKENKDEIIFWSLDKGGTLGIYKQDKSSIYSTKSTPLWVVQTSNLYINKGFDTKGEALAFAKKYMRSH